MSNDRNESFRTDRYASVIAQQSRNDSASAYVQVIREHRYSHINCVRSVTYLLLSLPDSKKSMIKQCFIYACQWCVIVGGCSLLVPLVIHCSTSFLSAWSEHRKINTYVQTDCLVMNSSLESCGVTRTKQGDLQCFRLKWRIEYVQYRYETETVIIHSDNYWKSQSYIEDQLQTQLRKYLVCLLQREEYNLIVEPFIDW